MKSFWGFKHIAAMMAIALSVGCADDSLENTTPNLAVDITENPDYETIRNLGYNTGNIIELDSLYVVEGDILIEKSYVNLLTHRPATRQARYSEEGKRLQGGREESIRVKITTVSAPDWEWREAARQAIDIWNSVPNCRVRFYKIEQQILSADIRFEDKSDLASNVIAAALPPKDGKPQDLFYNPAFNAISLEEKIFVMVHEFGHTVGLAHTDIMNTNNPAVHFPGTPNWTTERIEDYDSVMRSYNEGREAGDVTSWTGFTQGDLAAIQVMYGTPIWSQSITGPAISNPLAPAGYTFELGTNLTGLPVSWYANGTLLQTSSEFNTFRGPLPAGNVQLKASVTYDGREYYATKSVASVDPAAPPAPVIWPTEVHVMTPGSGTVFADHVVPGATYQWERSGSIDPKRTGSSYQIDTVLPFPPGYRPTANAAAAYPTYTLRCRVVVDGHTSPWSNVADVYIERNSSPML